MVTTYKTDNDTVKNSVWFEGIKRENEKEIEMKMLKERV